jgi:probable F420-dependent oxidoreductase
MGEACIGRPDRGAHLGLTGRLRIVLVLTENWTLVDPRQLDRMVEMARVAEDSGIDAVMLSEHIVLGPTAGASGIMGNPRDYAMPGNQDPAMPWPDSVVIGAAIAAATKAVRIVLAAVIAPLRHPLPLAKQLATLDLLSEGRLVVQPTVGWHEDEYQAVGVPFEERGRRLDEQLEIWSLVWASSPASYKGRYYEFEDMYLEPKPTRSEGPRLWIGGSSVHPAVARRLTRHGDGFHPLGQPGDDELASLRGSIEEAGRDPREIEWVGGVRGRFPDDRSPADLDEALQQIPAQVNRGFESICIKPSQFIDSSGELPAFCEHIMRRSAELVS